ncbi:MAG: glycosyltransferase [Bacteroidia bacterium]|nr:glycosyltransferase [Bacteroidia bacterium]
MDSRIILDDHPNIGRARSINRAIERAKGEIIAMIDADDVMLPSRLEEQLKFLEANPQISMTSCYCYLINKRSEIVGIQKLGGFDSIEACRKNLETTEPVICAQTGFMCYREAILTVGGYRPIWPAEDIDLFTRMVEKGFLLVSPPKILMKYRVHNQSVMANRDIKLQYRSAWVMYNIVQRRTGKPEISLEQYLADERKEPWRKRLDRKRRYYAYHFYRTAGIYYSCQEYFPFLWRMSVAFLLSPDYVFGKFAFQLKNRKLFQAKNKQKDVPVKPLQTMESESSS